MEGGSPTLTAPMAAAGQDTGSRTIAYQPALDGVRALAVLAVLLFHGGVAGFDGGYLGVSVFFTLSGYLITTLLVAEMERDGRIALREFYARRARRLLPASVLVVIVLAVTAAITDWFDAIDELRIQLVGSLLQIANWVFLASEGSYQDLLEQSAGAASPVEHYWSLAIEEQFYWLWPLAFVALWRLGGSRRSRTVVLAGATVGAFVAAPVIAAVWGPDAAYWSTPARAGEILVGALVGFVLVGRRVPARAALLAPIALVVLAAAVVLFPTRGGPAYSGALPAIGVVSAVLLIGLQADSAIRRWCSVAPLVWLGKISYGVYLFHWPIFVVMNEERVGVDGPLLLAMRLLTTLVVAQLSYTLFEQPIRRGLRITPRTTLIGAGVATAGAIALSLAIVPAAAGRYWEASDADTEAAAIVADDTELGLIAPPDADTVDEAAAGFGQGAGAPGVPPSPEAEVAPPADEPANGPTADESEPEAIPAEPNVAPVEPDARNDVVLEPAPIPEPSRPVRMIVAGDSTAVAFGSGMVQWAADEPTYAQVEVHGAPGCGFVRGGEFELGGEWLGYEAGCERFFYEDLVEQAAALQPDVVALVTTSWDVLNRRWPQTGDPAGDTSIVAAGDRVTADFADLTQRLLDEGVPQVVWVEMPMPDPEWDPAFVVVEDPDRHAVLHAAMASAAADSDRVHVLDFDSWFSAQGFDEDRAIRPDGTHVTPEVSEAIAVDFLGDRLLRVALGIA